MPRVEKEAFVSELKGRLAKVQGMIFADYRGLTVAQLTQIRRELATQAGGFYVVKNRLAKLVLKDGNVVGMDDHLKGPTAIAVTTLDVVPMAKTLVRYVDETEKLKIKGGYVGGKVLTMQQVTALSKLPSREQIYAQLLGVLQGPARGLVGTLSGVARKLVMVLKAIETSKSNPAS